MASTGPPAGTPAVVFEDIFEVQTVNPEGKRFDRVDRLVCSGETYETALKLDIASEMISFKTGDKYTMALAWTLDKSGKPDSDYYDPDGKPTLLDDYDYGMCGKVFKYEYMEGRKVSVVASFGGLLMLLQGEQRHIRLQLDQKIYCLIRKVGLK